MMKVVEILAHSRIGLLGKGSSNILRKDAKVPGILYGKGKEIYFYAYMAQLKSLVGSVDACFIDLNLEGVVYKCVLQELQLHPVSGMMIHVDMLEISDESKIKMDIPVVTEGKSPGVALGGILSLKVRKLPVKAFAKDMPESIKVDLTKMELKGIVRVVDVKSERYEILKVDGFPIVSIELSRALKSSAGKKAK